MNSRQTVTFTFSPADYDGEIRTIGVMGTFLFYESGLTGHTCATGMGDNQTYFNPHQYREGLEFIGMRYYEEMTRGEDGLYRLSFDLPAGMYSYRFAINAVIEEQLPEFPSKKLMAVCVDGRMHGFGLDTVYLPDPKRPPRIPTVTGQQEDSVFFVGDWNDYAWLPGAPEKYRGEVHYLSYEDVEGNPQSLGVYLPAGFSREKTYPAVFVSHGGGGNEADWFYQGGLDRIMDSLLARGETEPAILVTMNNSVYAWDYDKIAANLYERILPLVRRLFPVSGEVERNAFCGLSMGSMTTLVMYMRHNTAFRYFGAFSGGVAGGKEFTLEDPALMEKRLFIGCAEEDIAWNEREIGIPPTLRALQAKGVPFTQYFVPGGHDWYCWPQMFEEFAKNFLWK